VELRDWGGGVGEGFSGSLAGLVLLLVLGLSGCRQAPIVHTYAVQGTVLGMSAVTHQVTIHQSAIHGFLPAENVAYTLKDPSILGALEVGQQLQAQAMAAADNSYPVLTHVTVTEQPPESLVPSELPAHHLLVGERVPATPLVNEAGKIVNLQQYRGKALLLTFIDTRCTDDCPIISGLFARVNALLAKSPKVYADSKLISISIDPAYDRPPVLRRYGLEYLHTPQGFAHWEFVDSTPGNLQRLAKSFGEVYFPTKDDIDHTMDTVLIAPNSTFVRTWDGTHWKPGALVRAVEAVEHQAPS
jgi:protein SCO1/2